MHKVAVLLAITIPIVAYPFTEATLHRDDVRACASRLTTLANTGQSNIERAAFLILQDDGSFSCKVWREPGQWRRASFSGRIPDGTVAIMHTHPPDSPEPSAHDEKEATRLDAPVIVVCRGQLALALPGGKNSARARAVSNDVYTLDPDETAAIRQPDPR